MVDVSIVSGYGVKNSARVGENGRTWTHAMTHRESQVAGLIGRKFSIYTDEITITNAVRLPVLYFKNTGINDIAIQVLVYNRGASTGGAGNSKVEVVRNPRAGDIITAARPALIGLGINSNQNYGSTDIFPGVAYEGLEGDAVFTDDDGVHVPTLFDGPSGRTAIDLDDIVMPPNTSLGILFTPATGNTSQIVQFGAALYERNNEISGITKV